MPGQPSPRSSAFRSAELAVGDVSEFLREHRGQGQSFNSIALLLRDRGVVVTYETIRGWCERFEIDTAEVAS